MIDLCYICVQAIHGRCRHLSLVRNSDGEIVTEIPREYLNAPSSVAQYLVNPEKLTRGSTGESIPVFAVTTVRGSRVCAIHIDWAIQEASDPSSVWNC